MLHGKRRCIDLSHCISLQVDSLRFLLGKQMCVFVVSMYHTYLCFMLCSLGPMNQPLLLGVVSFHWDHQLKHDLQSFPILSGNKTSKIMLIFLPFVVLLLGVSSDLYIVSILWFCVFLSSSYHVPYSSCSIFNLLILVPLP